MSLSFMRIMGVASVMCLLVGCSTLPSQGPLAADIEKGATSADGEQRYDVVDLTESVVSILARYANPTFLKQFGDYRPSPNPVIGVGDSLAVTVWEAASGGLFSAPSMGGVTAGSHSSQIPSQIVDRDGSITVPYANRIHVAGLTTHQVEQAIVRNLTGKAIEPQALVTVTGALSNAVTVTGEVTNGARVPLSVRGDKVLDIVATVGGVRSPVHDTFVSLTRGNHTATVPMQELLNNPRENVFLRPGDILSLVRNPQTFTAFGATGRNSVVPFDALGMTLEEAVAKSGGLLDMGSDPEGVFLLRPEPADLARQLDPTFQIAPGQRIVNVIYRVNLRDANTYFLARRFAIHDKDMIYVAAAEFNQLQKVLLAFSTTTQPLVTAASICLAAGKC